jgi:enamine deaminase RidA (YjgF/YER057c/UK114 family)
MYLEKLNQLGLELPDAAAAVANYLPYMIENNQIFISGQISSKEGKLITGTLGKDLTIEEGIEAAKYCGLSIIAQLNKALEGDLGRIKQCIKLGIFVNSTPDFSDQPKVANGASDLMGEVFGEKGKHSRSAVGVNVLPLNVAVEIDAIFALN